MTTADDLIEAIKINAPNLYHIAETGKINGSLHADLKATIESLLQQVEQLEAERSEVIRRIKSILKASTVHDKISILEELEQLLNSLKTK